MSRNHSNRPGKFGSSLAAMTGVAGLAAGLLSIPAPERARASTPGAAGYLPLAFFVPNRGQADNEVRYTAKLPGAAAWFRSDQVILNLAGTVIRISLAGARRAPEIEGLDRLEGKVNFLIGGDRRQWETGLPAYEGISYRQVYPGIDVHYRVSGGRLKSEFLVAPGSDPSLVRIRYGGVTALDVTEGGELVLDTPSGQVREERPEIYQEIHGRRVGVEGGFRVLPEGEVGFRIGSYDRRRPLWIDPLLSYSTYLGGSGSDTARAVAVDGAGNAYIAGYTDSLNFPAPSGVQSQSGGGVDAFVVKLNPAGTSMVYCTYLGGGWDDRAFGVALDGAGNAYVTGWTTSPNFPTTAGARQRMIGGGRDAFLAKLNGAGSALVYSTYVGGSGNDSGNGIALDSAGNAYVAGDTYSINFPVLNAFQGSNRGRQEAWVAKLNASGSAMVWSTYLGGYGDDSGVAVAVDASGDAYVTGATDSANFPVLGAFQSANGGWQDTFVAKLSGAGRNLVYSTYLGGSGGTVGANEMGTGIAVDTNGNAYVAGITSSTNFPLAGALQAAHGGGIIDSFAAKLNPAGSGLVYSTYLGGYGLDYALSIAVDAAGSAYVAGYTSSANFPVVNPIQASISGGYDGFIAKLTSQGSALSLATYFGGTGSDSFQAVAVDSAGSIFAAGQTLSSNLPLQDAFQNTNAGGLSAFVVKLSGPAPRGAFRSGSGAPMLNFYGSIALQNPGGTIVSDPAIAVTAAGDTLVVGRNSSNQVWMNTFQNDLQSWRGWVLAGGPKAGNPAVVSGANGEAYVLARDANFAYWINRYSTGSGFEGWVFLGGTFTTEPEAVAALDGSVTVLGRTTTGPVWSGRYVPAQGFQGWWASSGSAAGRPSAALGTDGAVYVAVKGTDFHVWMARLQGDAWGPWFDGGGTLAGDPQTAAAGGLIYTLALGSGGGVYVQPFCEGTGNGWQGWAYTGGTLESASVAAAGAGYYVFGRNAYQDLWWYQSGGTGWSLLGYSNWAVGNLAAAPR